MAVPTPIIPPDPIEANVDYRYDGCYQSMVLVLLQRVVDASGGGGGTGLATEAKQDTQITLATAANALLTSLEGKDFATQTTLEAVRVLIASLDGKDYATETTLASIKTVVDNIKLDTAKLDVNLSTRATETTLEAVRVLLASIDGKDFATETTLAAIKAQTDLLNFTGAKLRTTGEDASGGGGGASAFGDNANTSTVALSDVSTAVLAADTDRKEVIYYNDSSNDIYLFFGTPAVFGTGVLLTKKQQFVSERYRGQVTAIMDTGKTGNLQVTEVVL
jgi:hypothetical protein